MVGLVSLFGVMLVRKPLKPQAVWPSVGLGLLQTSAYTIAIVMALVSGGAGKTAVLVFTMPFWTLLLSRLFLDEPVHRRQWFAVLLAFSGLMLIIQPWQLQGSLLSQILAIAGGFLWAASSVFAKRLRAAHTVDSLSLTTWQMVFGIVPLALFAWWTPGAGHGVVTELYVGFVLLGGVVHRLGVVAVDEFAQPPAREHCEPECLGNSGGGGELRRTAAERMAAAFGIRRAWCMRRQRVCGCFQGCGASLRVKGPSAASVMIAFFVFGPDCLRCFNRRPRRSMSQINVVPYIDVMLVLLVIFYGDRANVYPRRDQSPERGEKRAGQYRTAANCHRKRWRVLDERQR